MPYVVPERWAHGDFPTAAKMNKYKTGMDYINELVGDASLNRSVLHRGITVHSYVIVHRYRWLLYLGSGRIDDPYEGEESITISGNDSVWTTYDLTQIEWITPGRVYQVEALIACMEDFEPT